MGFKRLIGAIGANLIEYIYIYVCVYTLGGLFKYVLFLSLFFFGR